MPSRLTAFRAISFGLAAFRLAGPGANPDSEPVLAEDAWEGNSEALAKQAKNPLTSLISFPIQWNSTTSTRMIPSATDIRPSGQRWSAGPAGVAVYTKGPRLGGVLVNNVRSFAGEGSRDVNAMLIQPFLNYNLPGGWYLISFPILTADWTALNGKGIRLEAMNRTLSGAYVAAPAGQAVAFASFGIASVVLAGSLLVDSKTPLRPDAISQHPT